MKIALCFSGQPRSFKAGYEYYRKNLLDKYDVDVFIHTWTCPAAYEFINLYHPVAVETTGPLLGDFESKYTLTPDAKKWPPRFTVSALYSQFRSCLLKIDHEVKTRQYDWVIRTRSDFALPVEIPFDKMSQSLIHMPPCRTKAFGDWLGNDQFAVGGSSIMNLYMSTYINLERFYNDGVEMIGEEMLRQQLVDNQLKSRVGYIDMPPPFPPGPRNGTPHFLIRDDVEQWTNS